MLLGFKNQFVNPILEGEKIHTIRDDVHDRWQQGKTIHMCTGLRTKDLNIFNIKPCISVQKIVIDTYHEGICILNYKHIIRHDWLQPTEIEILIRHDGFKRLSDFWEWFRSDSKMTTKKLIHWTHLTYPIEGISDLPF